MKTILLKINRIIIFILSIIVLLVIPHNSFAEEYLKDINYQQNIKIWKEFNIDLTSIKKDLEDNFHSKVIFEWNIKWDITKT